MAALVGRQITLDLGAVVVVARGNNGLDTGVEWSGEEWTGRKRSLARSRSVARLVFSVSGAGAARAASSVIGRHVASFARDKSRSSLPSRFRGFGRFVALDTFLFVLFGQNNILILIVCVRQGDYFV